LATARASGNGYSQRNSYSSANEEKIIMEQNVFCIEKQMEYLLSSDLFDEGEKKQAKADLMKLVKEINELSM
jgi:hypothetical protein